MSGGERQTTNNRMELRAAIEGLEALDQPSEVNLYTDSQYVRLGITQWISKWRSNQWQTVNKQAVKNRDLWQRLDELITVHKVRWHWVRGHSGNKWNELVDRMARSAIGQEIPADDVDVKRSTSSAAELDSSAGETARTDPSKNEAGKPEVALEQPAKPTGAQDRSPLEFDEVIHLHTAACFSTKENRGAWAAVLRHQKREKALVGNETQSSANRMHLVAALEGLKAIKKPLPVHVYTGSSYLKDGASCWIEGWKRRKWRTSEGEPVAHLELWQELDALASKMKVGWYLLPEKEQHQARAKKLAREKMAGSGSKGG